MINLHNVDCIEYLSKTESDKYDLIVTDPPYELSLSDPTNSKIKSLEKYLSDDYTEIINGFDYEKVFTEWIRILKKVNIFCFCSNKQIYKILDFWKDYQTTVLVWHKTNPPPFANGVWRNDIEYIIHIREKGSVFNNCNAVMKKKVKEHPIVVSKRHPTEKPLKIIMDYIQIGSNENDLVLDPFMGSGTTGEACLLLNRNFEGLEINEKHFESSKKRLENHKSQLRLF